MNSELELVKTLEKISKTLGGVFTTDDLKLIIQPKHSNAYVLKVRKLIDAKVLFRFMRGIYLSETFDLATLSQRIEPNSYVSFETVLSKHLIIGIAPKNTIKAVKIGKNKIYKHSKAIVTHHGIGKHLFFGYYTKAGIHWAYPEKAWLDSLYFYQRGATYAFDVYSDVNLNLLNIKRVKQYLKMYRNPKFIRFAEGFL